MLRKTKGKRYKYPLQQILIEIFFRKKKRKFWRIIFKTCCLVWFFHANYCFLRTVFYRFPLPLACGPLSNLIIVSSPSFLLTLQGRTFDLNIPNYEFNVCENTFLSAILVLYRKWNTRYLRYRFNSNNNNKKACQRCLKEWNLKKLQHLANSKINNK